MKKDKLAQTKFSWGLPFVPDAGCLLLKKCFKADSFLKICDRDFLNWQCKVKTSTHNIFCFLKQSNEDIWEDHKRLKK